MLEQAQIDRRSFLRYVGAAVTGAATVHVLGPLSVADGKTVAAGAWVSAEGVPAWAPVAYPVPLPGDPGGGAGDAARLVTYEVRDELVLPNGFRYDVLATWGERFGGGEQAIQFGFNADYTGLAPVKDAPGEYWLIVNHEYISGRPWLEGVRQVHGQTLLDEDWTLAGVELPGAAIDLMGETADKKAAAAARRLCELAMSDLGVSVLRVRRREDGGFDVVRGSQDHLRVSAASGRASSDVAMRFAGPAAGLLEKPVGTFANCSGGTTPWGTFLSCEENFQDQVPEFITPAGAVLPGQGRTFGGIEGGPASRLPFEFSGLGTGMTPPLDGRQYGWVVEVDPVRRTLTKHTTMGRFRHENVALRVEQGKRLAAYMGDDRRGGHVWKFVSREAVQDPADPENTKLLNDGTLYVARFEEGFKGTWLAIGPKTPLRRPEPGRTAEKRMWLPKRPEGGHTEVDEAGVDAWVATVEKFAGKALAEMTLADLVAKDVSDPAGVIVMDAFAMANCAGGTPTARPEDIEVHPADRSVYISFTDATGSSDGSPDEHVFPDSKGDTSRQYGAIYRIEEVGGDPSATTFTWGKFVSSGEAADGGGGFACADNLVFDPQGNLWMVCDISTPSHNLAVTREGDTKPGAKKFPGVFGNNAMFMIPTRGPKAGVPQCFGIGPMECELTGPTFTQDGTALIVSVQHPGELSGTRGVPGAAAPKSLREMQLAGRDGRVFTQMRTVPLGSNFPSGKVGDVPRPCVVVIRRG